MNLEIKNKEIEKYLYILSKEIPDFLIEYANVKEMQRLKGISMVSACEHTKLIPYKFFHTRYEHSIGVALIVWNFTKDKKQTIAGLYHDIATPSFSHVVDYLHGDYEKQETTESLTERIIKNSEDIMGLLKRDNIKVEEIEDYHIYPIADNDSPRLSADRLEYTLSDGLVTQNAFSLDSIKRIYDNLTILKNEEMINELFYNIKPTIEDEEGNIIEGEGNSIDEGLVEDYDLKIEVLNGSGSSSKLSEVVGELEAAGFEVVQTGNTSQTNNTTIIDRNSASESAVNVLKQIMDTESITSGDSSESRDITIIIGTDYIM